MNLYELTQNAMNLQNMLESGEIDEEIFNDTLSSMGIEEKAENVCKMIRNLEARAAAFKEEKDRLAKRQSQCENGAKRLKESLLIHLTALDKTKMDAGLFSVTKCATTSANIVDENSIAPNYLVPQPPTIDKRQILADLKAGMAVPGAELSKTEYVRIR